MTKDACLVNVHIEKQWEKNVFYVKDFSEHSLSLHLSFIAKKKCDSHSPVFHRKKKKVSHTCLEHHDGK